MKFLFDNYKNYISGVNNVNNSSKNNRLIGSGSDTGLVNDLRILSEIIQIDKHIVRTVVHGGVLIRVEVSFVYAETKCSHSVI